MSEMTSGSETDSRKADGIDPALDGIRGLAILGVTLFHFGVPFSRWGFLGVDLFFALSGFLITRMLVGEYRQSARIDFGRFYARRAGRLLPALFLLCGALAGWSLLGGVDQPKILRAVAATLLYVQNWGLVLEWNMHGALSHAWSLSIEEQFYLIWPLAVAWMMHRGRGRARLPLSLACAALVSAVWRAFLFEGGERIHAYNGTDARLEGLLLGAALAFGNLNNRNLLAACRLSLLAAVGYVALADWTHSYGERHLYLGGFSLVALGSIGLIVEALRRESLVSRVLSVSPLRLLGRLSYSVYLWHYPVTLIVPGLESRIALTAACSAVCYTLVERPLRSAVKQWLSAGNRSSGLTHLVGTELKRAARK